MMKSVVIFSALLCCVLGSTLGPPEEFFDIQGTGLLEWRLVFRGTAYINKSVYTAYKEGTNIPAVIQDGCKTIDFSQLCDTHYRNYDALGSWDNIYEVMIGIVDKGKIVKTAIFDGTGSTYMNWMSEARYINSTWPDLVQHHPNIYGITGDNGLLRRFFISHNYGGCPNDAGWMVTVDRPTHQVPCDWEKDEAYPVFKYAAGDKFENWNTGNYRDADAIVIFVRYSSHGIVG